MTITPSQRKRALVVEDDSTLNRLLLGQLSRLGFVSRGAGSRAEALEVLEDFEPTLTVLDMRLPDTDGLDYLAELREICPVVVLTAYGSIEQAVKAVKAGASEYLIKPVSPHSLELAVNRALETEALKRSASFWQEQARPKKNTRMVGDSSAFMKVRQMIALVAAADTTVLLEGESGVGKELVAQAIHESSPRVDSPFVAVDCSTLQESLFESELFGHERGAFTGAERKKEGLVEVAEDGTVFLDEIGEVSPSIQAKLLRILETGTFRRVGGTRDLTANVRFIAATNRGLQDMVSGGSFRSDLYYRLSAFTINVPPLRARKSDIESIAQHFLSNRKFMRNIKKEFSPGAVKALASYSWPGNVRELRNVVERSVLLSAGLPRILREHITLPKDSGGAVARIEFSFDHEPTLDELRDHYLTQLLEMHCGNRQEVSRALGMSERNTYRLIKKLGLNKPPDPTSLS